MKKYFLVTLVVLITLFSCNSDDDSASVDPIVGTWKLIAEYEDNALVESDVCDLTNELVFYENYTISSKIYLDLKDEGNCSLWATSEGEWKNQSGLYYVRYVSTMYTDSNGTIENQNSEFEVANVTFLDNNNQMEVLYEEKNNGIITLYRSIYQKQ